MWLRWISLIGLIALTALSFLYFGIWWAAWLVVLAAVVYCNPGVGVLLFFIAASFDLDRPILASIVVSYSELELAVCLIALMVTRPLHSFDWRPMCWGLPFLVAVLLSGLANIEWYKVAPHVMRAAELAVCSQLASNVLREEQADRWIRWALLAAGVIYTVCGIFFSPFLQGRMVSLFTNPNQFAGYLGLLFPFFFAFFLTTVGRKSRFVWGYMCLLIIGALLFAASRIAFSALFFGVLVQLFLSRRKEALQAIRAPLSRVKAFLDRTGRTILFHLPLALAAIGFFYFYEPLHEPVDRVRRGLVARSDSSQPGGFLGYRLFYMRLGIEAWKENPLLGVGPGRWEEAVEGYLREPELLGVGAKELDNIRKIAHIHAHNVYVQLAANYGISGLLAFLYWMACIIRDLLVRGREPYSMAGLGLMGAYLFHNTLDVTYPSLGIETGLVLGFCLARVNSESQETGYGGDLRFLPKKFQWC